MICKYIVIDKREDVNSGGILPVDCFENYQVMSESCIPTRDMYELHVDGSTISTARVVPYPHVTWIGW